MGDIERLRAKLDHWRACIDGDDVHSIRAQTSTLLWRSAFFRSVNEARKFIPNGEEANGTLHEFVTDGYVLAHTTSVRRLLDNTKGVNSLVKLIQDMKACTNLLTRANVLAVRDLEYEFEPIRDRAREEARLAAAEEGKTAYNVSGNGWFQAWWWHKACDILSVTSEDNRSPSDHPSRASFQALINDLQAQGRRVVAYTDNYVAHAANAGRRESIHPEHRGWSLFSLWQAERAIAKVVGFLWRCVVDGADGGGVPIPQFDQFQYMNRPFVTDGALPSMRQAWDAHCDESLKCRGWSWDEPLFNDADLLEPEQPL